MSFKPGALSQDDVLGIAHELSSSWKMVGRALNVPDAVIDQIEANKYSDERRKCYSKCDCYSYRGLTHNFAILTSNCL